MLNFVAFVDIFIFFKSSKSTALRYSKWRSLLPLTTKATRLHHYQEAVLRGLRSSYWSLKKAKTNEKPRTVVLAAYMGRLFNSSKKIWTLSSACLVNWQCGMSVRGCHLKCFDLWFLWSYLGFPVFMLLGACFSNMECVWLALIFSSHLEGTHSVLNSATCASEFFLRLLTQVYWSLNALGFSFWLFLHSPR